MTDTPINFIEPQLKRIRGGRQSEVRRPHGRYARLASGDRLWIREPFHLSRTFDAIAPTSAIERGAIVVHWPADWAIACATLDGTIGRRRFARELPRACHRAHLVVSAVRTEQLQDIDGAGARREGLADRAAYAVAWDSVFGKQGGRAFNGESISWNSNPRVDVIAFDFIDAPLAARP